ncbi:MAG TPA: GspMb/PilO family protein [Vicinamibacterales bacterium]|jgi:hypothetical protein|nr:GspMb/PilO family protein [Vicinamibacterales bacterium]
MTPLLKRVALEKRAILLPLAVALVANIVAYAFIVRPLALRSTGSAERAATAQAARRDAEREEGRARALVTGKAKADEELKSFYEKVLPADLPTARRMTFAPLEALARKTNVKFLSQSFAPEERSKDARDQQTGAPPSDLSRLAIKVTLQGDYRNVRAFIYQLETAPEFVIIDSVNLTEAQAGEAESVSLELSTYFKQAGNGL